MFTAWPEKKQVWKQRLPSEHDTSFHSSIIQLEAGHSGSEMTTILCVGTGTYIFFFFFIIIIMAI
jgi:hypothetical protein